MVLGNLFISIDTCYFGLSMRHQASVPECGDEVPGALTEPLVLCPQPVSAGAAVIHTLSSRLQVLQQHPWHSGGTLLVQYSGTQYGFLVW